MNQLKYLGLVMFTVAACFLIPNGLPSSRPLNESVFTLGVIAICGAVLSLWR